MVETSGYAVGWFTLALINAGLAQAKNRSGTNWFLVSLLLGPIATLLIVVQKKQKLATHFADVSSRNDVSIEPVLQIGDLSRLVALFRHERITTTEAKAKAVRGLADQMITLAKRESLHARRQVSALVPDAEAVRRLFDTIAARFGDRHGGYTRIIRVGPRPGDAAPMVLLELVDRPEVPKDKSAKGAKKEKAPKGEAEAGAPKERKKKQAAAAG